MKTTLLGILTLCSILFFNAHTFAQKFAAEKSDPKAKAMLNKMRDKYKAFKGMKVEYSLTIEQGDRKEVQNGKIEQKGEKFRVLNGDNEMICDGKTVWMCMKKKKEVQITTYDPNDDETLSPNKIFNIQDADKKYIYAITGTTADATEIEFKPIDKDSDYSKMRIKIIKAKDQIEHVKIFMKDGTRYTLDVKKIDNADFADTLFAFDKAQYPGVRITDLRD